MCAHAGAVIATAVTTAVLAAAGCGGGGGVGGGARASAVASPVRDAVALRLVEAPTPRFAVPHYETTGTFAQVEGTRDLERVNAALRRIVIDDQRAYEPSAREDAPTTPSELHGYYRTRVDRRLVSASSAVVSVLMPATHLYPGGNHGSVLVSGTVRVPSGRRVRLTELFADPARALPVLAREFDRAFRRQDPSGAVCLNEGPWLHPTAHNYRHFALLEGGLALGFPHLNCRWLIATIPYDRLRPYFNQEGRELVAGVRAPATR